MNVMRDYVKHPHGEAATTWKIWVFKRYFEIKYVRAWRSR